MRYNPLIERSINLITLVKILLIVVMIPGEGIHNEETAIEDIEKSVKEQANGLKGCVGECVCRCVCVDA